VKVTSDPYKSSQGAKAAQVVDLIKAGTEPEKAAEAVGVSLESLKKDKELSKILSDTLREWYYDDTIAEATAKAALLKLGLLSEDEKTQVAALGALLKSTKKEVVKGPSTAIQINVTKEVERFIEEGGG